LVLDIVAHSRLNHDQIGWRRQGQELAAPELTAASFVEDSLVFFPDRELQERFYENKGFRPGRQVWVRKCRRKSRSYALLRSTELSPGHATITVRWTSEVALLETLAIVPRRTNDGIEHEFGVSWETDLLTSKEVRVHAACAN
jgi:hypothetical protein